MPSALPRSDTELHRVMHSDCKRFIRRKTEHTSSKSLFLGNGHQFSQSMFIECMVHARQNHEGSTVSALKYLWFQCTAQERGPWSVGWKLIPEIWNGINTERSSRLPSRCWAGWPEEAKKHMGRWLHGTGFWTRCRRRVRASDSEEAQTMGQGGKWSNGTESETWCLLQERKDIWGKDREGRSVNSLYIQGM